MEVTIRLENPLKKLKAKMKNWHTKKPSALEDKASRLRFIQNLRLYPKVEWKQLFHQTLGKINELIIWVYIVLSGLLLLGSLSYFVFFAYFTMGIYIGIRYLRLYLKSGRKRE